MNKRPKASAINKQVMSFKDAFPTLKDITGIVKEFEYGRPLYGDNSGIILKKDKEYFDCHNDLCFGGGFNVWEIIEEMIKNKQNKILKDISCIGYEGTRTRKEKNYCNHTFKFELEIVNK
jgi:hypothetical protein